VSLRAILIGLLGVAFVCGYTHFNDNVMRQTMFVGNSMPISVYGLLVIFLLFLFPLLRKINRKLLLSRKEIVVVLAMVLASCAIPGSNLLRLFTPALIMPNRYQHTEPGWQNRHVMDLVPEGMLVDVTPDEETILNGYCRGLSTGTDRIGVGEVPWRAWVKPVFYWMPIILSLWIALIGLSLVVHRQWSKHEHLPYPIVTFTKSLLPQENGEPSPVFKNRLFWLGLISVVCLHGYNYLNVWFPEYMPGKIPLGVDYSSIGELFTTFEKGGGAGLLSWTGTIFLTVVAVAYFLPSDVSFSLGIGPLVWVYLVGAMSTYGLATTGWQSSWPYGITRDSMVDIGAYTGLLLVLLYLGFQIGRRPALARKAGENRRVGCAGLHDFHGLFRGVCGATGAYGLDDRADDGPADGGVLSGDGPHDCGNGALLHSHGGHAGHDRLGAFWKQGAGPANHVHYVYALPHPLL